MMQFEKVHPLQSGLIRMKHPSEQRPGLAPESILMFYARYLRDLIVRNAAFLRTTRWILIMAWRIAHDPNRLSYVDTALLPVGNDEDETFDYLTKTDGAKAAINHLKKIAELTHKVAAPAAPLGVKLAVKPIAPVS
jgi:hypothetical protein